MLDYYDIRNEAIINAIQCPDYTKEDFKKAVKRAMWVNISTWSIKLPGVIFTLDLDGIFFLIAVKILGALLSLAVTIFCVIFATALGFALSIFVYPFALIKNIKGIE